jgi:hypothetical protein
MWQLCLDDRLLITGLTTAEALALLRSLTPTTAGLVSLIFDARR